MQDIDTLEKTKNTDKINSEATDQDQEKATGSINDRSDMYLFVAAKRKDQDEVEAQLSDFKSVIVVLLSWVFGILFTKIFLRGGFGLSVPLLMTAFYGIAVWYLSSKQPRPSAASYIMLIPIGLISLGYMLNDNLMIYLINTLVLMALLPLQLAHMSNTALGRVFSLKSFYSSAVSTIARPLSFLDIPFKAVFTVFNKGKKQSKVAIVFLGILLAIPISAVFVGLFIKADEVFGFYVNRIMDYLKIYPLELIIDIFLGSLVGLFVSALLITLRARRRPEDISIKVKGVVDGLLATTVITVLDIFFGIFVCIQFGYLFSRASLPSGMSYAEYARRGFFELCAVAFISFFVILACLAFVREGENRKLPMGLSIMLTLFIGCNFVVTASAIYRMAAYISAYDLSVKRVIATWLIVLISTCFVGFIIGIWNRKLNIVNYVAVAVVVMTVLLNSINLNGLIAEYNVNMHFMSLDTERVREVDINYLASLGPSAAKATEKLLDSGHYHYSRDTILGALASQRRMLMGKDWRNYCVWDSQADRVFKRYESELEKYDVSFGIGG